MDHAANCHAVHAFVKAPVHSHKSARPDLYTLHKSIGVKLGSTSAQSLAFRPRQHKKAPEILRFQGRNGCDLASMPVIAVTGNTIHISFSLCAVTGKMSAHVLRHRSNFSHAFNPGTFIAFNEGRPIGIVRLDLIA